MISHDSIEKWQKVCNRLAVGQNSPVPGLGPMLSVHDIASAIQYISQQLAAAHGGTHRGLEESEKIIILARAMESIAAEHDKSNFKRTKQRSDNDFEGVVKWWAQDFDAMKVSTKVSALKASRASDAAVNAVQRQPSPQQNSRGRGGGKTPSGWGLRPKSTLVPAFSSDRREFYKHLENLPNFIKQPLKYSEQDEKARGDQFVAEMKKWLALPKHRSMKTTTREDLYNKRYRDPTGGSGGQSKTHLEDVDVGSEAPGFVSATGGRDKESKGKRSQNYKTVFTITSKYAPFPTSQRNKTNSLISRTVMGRTLISAIRIRPTSLGSGDIMQHTSSMPGTYRTNEPQPLAFATIHAILKPILTQTPPTQTLLMCTYYFGDVLDLGSMNHDINRTPRQIVIMCFIWSYGP